MREYHVISAKRKGWDNGDRTYEHFFFSTDQYGKEEAIAQFRPVQKETLKNNRWCHIPYQKYKRRKE